MVYTLSRSASWFSILRSANYKIIPTDLFMIMFFRRFSGGESAILISSISYGVKNLIGINWQLLN